MVLSAEKIRQGLIYTFIGLAVFYSVFTVGRIFFDFQLQDFRVYYLAVRAFIIGSNPYIDWGAGVYLYPPASLVFLSPFGLLEYELAERIWTLVSFGSLVAAIMILLRILRPRFPLKQFLVVFSLAMLSFPVKFTLGMGQINLILLFFVCLSFYFYRERKQYLSGLTLAVATAVKLSPVFLILFYIRKKQVKVLVGFLFGIAGFYLFGQRVFSEYWLDVFSHIPTIGNGSYYNQSLTGWLARGLVVDETAKIINYFVFASLLVFSFKMTAVGRKNSAVELAEYGLFILATLLGAGLAWQHHFALAVVPFMAIWQLGNKRKLSRPVFVLGTFSYLLIAWNMRNPQFFSGWGGLLLSHVFYGALLLYWLLHYGLRNSL
jgi:hypothetical protein